MRYKLSFKLISIQFFNYLNWKSLKKNPTNFNVYITLHKSIKFQYFESKNPEKSIKLNQTNEIQYNFGL